MITVEIPYNTAQELVNEASLVDGRGAHHVCLDATGQKVQVTVLRPVAVGDGGEGTVTPNEIVIGEGEDGE